MGKMQDLIDAVLGIGPNIAAKYHYDDAIDALAYAVNASRPRPWDPFDMAREEEAALARERMGFLGLPSIVPENCLRRPTR
jgi:hypothetical protein